MNLIVTNRSPSPSEIIKSLLFIPYESVNDKWHPVLGQGWTLNYEVFFYLVFGLSLYFRRGLPIVFSTFILLSAAQSAGLLGTDNILAFWSDSIVLYFLGGILIGLARPSIARRPGFSAASSLALAAMAIAAGTAALWGAASTVTTIVTPCAALAAVAACCWAGEGMNRNVLSRSAKAIGDATYSIYLTHTLVIGPSANAVGRLAPGLPVAGFVALMIVLTVIVGLFVYRFVERPIMTGWAAAFGRRSVAGQPRRLPEPG